ncbi:glutathione-specific gamma-glutamylcyclotransferase 1 [Amia ocellicauda]|uniref:glutathione-specific gamma-glutamylcyclotransferase 1 n=1 Tax=Amia ocellicauda TaxID=2972642 RepID=UPI003464634A
MKIKDITTAKSSLWIFGYGSLVWKPDFQFSRSKVGYIQGYKRRFWHGDNFHRGNNDMPGRVVTLVEDHDACTYGIAYEVTGSQIQESLKYLNVRENVLGGYVTKLVEFIPRADEPSVLALVYIATSDNPIYLGPATSEEIAAQIVVSSGKTGHNVEYLFRLADFMRLYCPEVEDDHLFSIEAATLSLMPY